MIKDFTCPDCGLKIAAVEFPVTCRCGARFDGRAAKVTSGKPAPPKRPALTSAETAELFPGESDPTLLGNRLAALTAAIGIPPCGGCEKRKAWLNKAHAWLRGLAADALGP